MWRPSTISALVPDVHTFDRGGQHYRPGVVWAIDGGTATIRVFCAPGDIRAFEVSTSALPNAGIGAPIVARFTSTAYETVAALIPTTWARGHSPGTDEAGAVARGELYLAVIPRPITGAPRTYWRESETVGSGVWS